MLKNPLLLILSAILLAFLASCQKETANKEGDSSQAVSQPKSAESKSLETHLALPTTSTAAASVPSQTMSTDKSLILAVPTPSHKYDGQTITVLFMSSVYADAARLSAKQFEESTGCKVEVVDFPYVTLHEKELLDISTDSGTYDVISIACQWDGEFAPFMTDLAPLAERDKHDLTDFNENIFSNAGKWAGKIMAIPHANTPYVMAYRTDLVPEFPATWEEYLETCKKLTDKAKGFYGTSLPGLKEQLNSVWMIRHWSMGGRWADGNWTLTIDSPETRRSLDHLKQTLQYADPAAPAWGLQESIAAFLQGNAAFCESWPTLGITLDGDNAEKSKIVGKWALHDFPHDKTGKTMLSAWDVGIPKGARNKDAAWDFIKLYTSAESQLDFFKKFAILSPRKSFWQQDAVKTSKSAPLEPALDRSVIWWRISAGTVCETAVRDAVASYATGQWDMDKTVNYMKTEFEKALAANPPEPGTKNTGL